MRKYLDKKQMKWFRLLILALLAYTVKNIFVGADVDEGYGIMLGYRLLQGDKLLLEMWEPHQTSGIFTALFMGPFVGMQGGGVSFLNLYLRVIFFAVQGLLCFWVYRTLVVCVPRIGNVMSALLAVFVYVSSPKCIYIPEYSNLQVWFTTAMILCLVWYFGETSPLKGKVWLPILAGVFLACDVLAYPSMVLLFPVTVGCIVWWCRKQQIKDRKYSALKTSALFTLPCIVGALVFIGYVLSYMTIAQIGQVLPHILGEGSHQTQWSDKLNIWLQDVETVIALIVVGGLLAAGIAGVHCAMRKRQGKDTVYSTCRLFWFFVIQTGFQMVYWVFGMDAVAYPQVNYLFMAFLGIYCYYKAGKKETGGMGMVVIALCGYLAVLLLSNWGPNNLNPYLVLGAVGGFLCWDFLLESWQQRDGKKWLQTLLYIMIIGNVFGYSYRMIGGNSLGTTILEVRGYNHAGVRAFILTDYMTAHRYNVNLESWDEMVPAGSNLLYVGPSQFSYMHGECVVATGNTISTPTYDETMLDYWELNPDRYPDVVAVESMYGEITAVTSDNYILQWLEEEFRATEIIEYPYVTIYKR